MDDEVVELYAGDGGLQSPPSLVDMLAFDRGGLGFEVWAAAKAAGAASMPPS